jgi:hypothetical protein
MERWNNFLAGNSTKGTASSRAENVVCPVRLLAAEVRF